MKKEILKVANTLVMMEPQIKDIGLMDGKMGACILLYHLSRITNYKFYEDIADRLLDEIMDAFYPDMNLSFSNGLIGVTFGINRLIKHRFIDADPNEIFENIDQMIFSEIRKRRINDFTEEFPLFSYGLYLIERIPYIKLNKEINAQVEHAFEVCEKNFNANSNFNSKRIIYVNSILFFLGEIRNRSNFYDRANSIMILIIKKINEALSEDPQLAKFLNLTKELVLSFETKDFEFEKFLHTLKRLIEQQSTENSEKNSISRDEAWQSILFSPRYEHYSDFVLNNKWFHYWDVFYESNYLMNGSCNDIIVNGILILIEFYKSKKENNNMVF